MHFLLLLLLPLRLACLFRLGNNRYLFVLSEQFFILIGLIQWHFKSHPEHRVGLVLTIDETKNVRLPHRNVTLLAQQLFAWLFFVGETNSSTRIAPSFVVLFFLFLV